MSKQRQKRLYLGNISKRSDKGDIKKLFEEVGPLVNFVYYDEDLECYIEYGTHEEAAEALDKFDNHKQKDGTRLLVEWA